jgi:hypothetical protein
MPIRPENKDRYPVNWKEIRAAVLKRAGNRCVSGMSSNNHRRLSPCPMDKRKRGVSELFL